MATRTSTSIEQLLVRLGPLLDDTSSVVDNDRVVSSLVLFDGTDSGDIADDSIVLAIGVLSQQDAAMLARAIHGVNIAAVVLRDFVARDDRVRLQLGADLPVLALRKHASWTQLTTTLAVVLGLGQGQGIDGAIFGDSETDLFTLANSVAGIVGGPVTIEDLSSTVLAFSSDQASADDARMQTVLGHQVPADYHTALHEKGFFRTVYESPSPIFLAPINPDVRGRTAMRVQAAGQLLGSVWVVTDSPLSAQRQESLAEAANVIALTMLRIRMANDAASRLRASRVLALLDGGVVAREAMKASKISAPGYAVTALGLHPESAVEDAGFELNRLASAFMMHMQSASPHAPVALLGDVVYAVIPLLSARPDRAKAQVQEFLARLSEGRHVLIGVGSAVSDAARLIDSRREADLALRVLRQRSPASGAATIDDVHVESLLLRMSDLMASSQETITGSLRLLVDYDAESGSNLVETLHAWLEHFGDISTAASTLMVHKNTFRYRLRRIAEVGKVDLSDSQQRFGLMLQLRLFML